ncbi:HVO_0234 family beta-propeller protein [Halorussus halobius]|uniref:HVO_0234 family beta-propeller protein n=1 Tax=Halorussus halobius TaxID=1710537 RepID=UPI001092212E|nr:hypothetical protein [Halorussus halobius]
MGISIDEKRVYDAREGPTPVYVVGEFGVARANTSDDLVGEFGLARQCSARDVAGRDGRIAVATDEDVLVATAGGDDGAGDSDGVAGAESASFEALEVGPTVAVGDAGDELVVAREDGAVLRGDGEQWTRLGDLDDVRAVEGEFVAAESGVHRAAGDDLRHVGLDDAHDVAAGGAPLAATGGGVYRLGNGWLDELSGDFRAVSAGRAADEATGTGPHAARADGRLFGGDGKSTDGNWREVELPVAGEVVALDHGESGCAYAVTDDGTLLLSVGDGWNYRRLGLRGVRAVAAP